MPSRKKKLKDQAGEYVDTVRPQIESAATTAKDEALALLAGAREKAGPALADARDKAAPYLAEARDRATELGAEARDRAVPAVTDALTTARDRAVPVIASGAAYAAAKTGELSEKAEARAHELAEPEKKKRHWVRNFVLVVLLAGAAGYVARRLQGGGKDDSWQSAYVPTPPAPPATPTTPAATEQDAGGSAPDEALADEAEAPKPPTTPDAPAVSIDVDDEKK